MENIGNVEVVPTGLAVEVKCAECEEQDMCYLDRYELYEALNVLAKNGWIFKVPRRGNPEIFGFCSKECLSRYGAEFFKDDFSSSKADYADIESVRITA